ncbi:hypothetical protein [Crenobacter caeni]|uniref:Phosphoglycerate mutase n=1 Tax=Crenobacter caeni TaxID=2705474 RepID=A0A6B2KQR4_9NEIS|nr:hypothetical protein [Crenobacter caeni]NDV12391.1 hypothetical protein [Crenobacter caeni]
MKLTLALPGLIWPDGHDAKEVLAGLPLPALSYLLGRGVLCPAPAALSALQSGLFGAAALAPARALAAEAGLEAAGGDWLLADPVHLRVNRDRAELADVGIMKLSQAEAASLIATLNELFGEDGLKFYAPEPGRWLLRVLALPDARFTALCDALGEDVNRLLPAGAEGLRWSKLMGEMQMLLYTHPVNDAREARGEPTVNSVWLWGGGAPEAAAAPERAVYCDDAWLARCAKAVQPLPWEADAVLQGGQDALVWLDRLLAPARYRDAWGYREALAELERGWFAPLLAALKAGRITELEIVCDGESGFSLTVCAADRWRFWRKARPLASVVGETGGASCP